MPQVSEVHSNFARVTKSYDEEMNCQQSYATPPPIPQTAPLSLEETVLMKEEENYLSAAGRRWDNQQHFMGEENEAMRLTRILHPHEVFAHLRKAGVDARLEAPSFDVWVADDDTGKPTLVKRERTIGRLWLHDNVIRDRVGISAWVMEKGVRVRRMVTSLQYPYGPEWSILRFDQYDVPIGERYRGWRTAILALILQDVITEAEAIRAFGPVALTPISLPYRERVQEHRKRSYGLMQ